VRTLLTIVRKDLRLLWRDRAGLIFLTVAPILVITVAGFSLANLYGADPTGQTAYAFPFVNEDGSELAQHIHDALARDEALQLRPVATRKEAERLVRDKQAGTALVVPQGTQEALRSGRRAKLVLYTDTVKYLERLNVLARLSELRGDLVEQEVERAEGAAREQRERLRTELKRLRSAVADVRETVRTARLRAIAARERSVAELRSSIETARQRATRRLEREMGRVLVNVRDQIDLQVAELRAPIRVYVGTLEARRRELRAWLAEIGRLAGSHAADIPPPPELPELPAALRSFLDHNTLPLKLPSPPAVSALLPPAPRVELPPLPAPPAIEIEEISLPEPPPPPGSLAVREVNVSGGPPTINTFDQNVPGFSVTFLLLGMLLGVSLALLDERDWGTFDRLRALPIYAGNVLMGKLLSRFLVGVVQMVVLLAVGWLAFNVSLGPQPWALLLPTAGIVFAGTAFGLVVAAVAPSREAVLPVGSIVIVTMAAVGGCWWPIDLEPRWMRSVALAFPTTWSMEAFNDLMIRRRNVEAALHPTVVMVAYGLLYLAVGLALFRRRWARSSKR
jgi:ABC-type multidrug transport system permease subunit